MEDSCPNTACLIKKSVACQKTCFGRERPQAKVTPVHLEIDTYTLLEFFISYKRCTLHGDKVVEPKLSGIKQLLCLKLRRRWPFALQGSKKLFDSKARKRLKRSSCPGVKLARRVVETEFKTTKAPTRELELWRPREPQEQKNRGKLK